VAVFVVLSLTTGCAWWQERSRTTKGEPARGDGGAAWRRTGSPRAARAARPRHHRRPPPRNRG